MNGQVGFYFDENRCVGCATCTVACKDWNDLPAGLDGWRRLITMERGRFPQVTVPFFPLSCLHCEDAPCVSVCPPNALRKREEDGVVVLDPTRCLRRCRLCAKACPFNVPRFDTEGLAMRQCDFCSDRWAAGEKPVCVLSCPQRALDAGLLSDLRGKYDAAGWPLALADPDGSRPALVVKGKSSSKPIR